MIFRSTELYEVYEVVIQRRADERGSFGRTFCRREFADHGLVAEFAQASTSVSSLAGTLRGMHYQGPPSAEAKLVRCSRGAIYDVVADLRPASPTCMRWQAFRLASHVDAMLYIPPGCAHGFQTLEDDTEVVYQMSTEYVPELTCGFRYDDPGFKIVWPVPITVIASKDLAWARFALTPTA